MTAAQHTRPDPLNCNHDLYGNLMSGIDREDDTAKLLSGALLTENKRLQSVIDELVIALKAAETPMIQDFEHYQASGKAAAAAAVWAIIRQTRAAIAKATGKS